MCLIAVGLPLTFAMLLFAANVWDMTILRLVAYVCIFFILPVARRVSPRKWGRIVLGQVTLGVVLGLVGFWLRFYVLI
jgi:hypothetical protein